MTAGVKSIQLHPIYEEFFVNYLCCDVMPAEKLEP